LRYLPAVEGAVRQEGAGLRGEVRAEEDEEQGCEEKEEQRRGRGAGGEEAQDEGQLVSGKLKLNERFFGRL